MVFGLVVLVFLSIGIAELDCLFRRSEIQAGKAPFFCYCQPFFVFNNYLSSA